MNMTISSAKLHFNKRETTFAVPLYITATVAVISVLISFLFWRFGSEPGSPGWVQGSQSNPGIAYALLGFLGYLGVQSVATTFPFALTLGAPRRAFVGGTFLWSVAVAAYLTVAFALLATIETATNHWFSEFYIFDVYVLGAGDLTLLIPIVFLGVLTLLSLGGVFGASWVRFGARGPQLIAVGIAIVVIGALIAILPAMSDILAAFELWWLAILAGAITALSCVGTWLLLRTATVR